MHAERGHRRCGWRRADDACARVMMMSVHVAGVDDRVGRQLASTRAVRRLPARLGGGLGRRRHRRRHGRREAAHDARLGRRFAQLWQLAVTIVIIIIIIVVVVESIRMLLPFENESRSAKHSCTRNDCAFAVSVLPASLWRWRVRRLSATKTIVLTASSSRCGGGADCADDRLRRARLRSSSPTEP
jgi:hypothetical protein